MKIPKEVQVDARRLMQLCLQSDGSLNLDTIRLIASRITAERPRYYIELLTAFTQFIRISCKRRTAIVHSAQPFSREQQEQITDTLNANHGRLDYEWKIKPSLLAGFTIQIGDELIDASVESRIERIAQI